MSSFGGRKFISPLEWPRTVSNCVSGTFGVFPATYCRSGRRITYNQLSRVPTGTLYFLRTGSYPKCHWRLSAATQILWQFCHKCYAQCYWALPFFAGLFAYLCVFSLFRKPFHILGDELLNMASEHCVNAIHLQTLLLQSRRRHVKTVSAGIQVLRLSLTFSKGHLSF